MIDALSRLGAGEYRDGSSTKAGWTYQPMGDFFPEMKGVRVHCADATRRTFGIISDRTGDGGTLIDLGCSTGYYLAGLRDLYDGDRFGFEADPSAAEVGRSLGLDCRHTEDIVEDMARFSTAAFGRHVTILALNVHMWWHKQGIADDVMGYLPRIADRLFFQTAGQLSRGRYRAPFANQDDERAYLSQWWAKVTLIDENPHHGGVRYLWQCER